MKAVGTAFNYDTCAALDDCDGLTEIMAVPRQSAAGLKAGDPGAEAGSAASRGNECMEADAGRGAAFRGLCRRGDDGFPDVRKALGQIRLQNNIGLTIRCLEGDRD